MKFFKKKQFTLEVGFSRKEFISLLESQDKLTYQRDENTVTFTFAGQNAHINLGKEGARHFASVRLPTLIVSFDFSEMGDIEQAQFMTAFLLKFQRGGG